MKRLIILLVLIAFVFVACDKNKTEEPKENQTEAQTQEQQMEDPRESIAEQLSKVKLDEEKVTIAVDKLPVWINVSRKYAEQLQTIQDMGQVDNADFVDKVPGMKEDLEKGGIDPENFFPILEKTLQGHMFMKSKEAFESRQEEYEKNKQQIAELLQAPDVSEEQKMQYQQMLANMEREEEMLKGTPPGFTEEEIELIKKRTADIDAIIEKVQMEQQAAAQQQQNP